ncbi:MAG: FHA domain-containing protein [Verrucomicrobia bacterium]|nr:FHA domain-containing protein [Verrucomicrobiota bacterium]
MARLVICSGPEQGLELELKRGPNALGRAPANDLLLSDHTVSGYHCELEVTDFSAKVKDLGSTNGTFVQGQRVLEAELKDGHQLRLGSLELRLALESPEIAIPTLTVPEAPGPRFLPDGAPACEQHHHLPATLHCRQCARAWCDDCVHPLRLAGGQTRIFCPTCSGPCAPLETAAAAAKRSLWLRLWDTLTGPARPARSRRRPPRPPYQRRR